MDLVDKIKEGQNFLEKIASAIPGFKGYREKERRREADRLNQEPPHPFGHALVAARERAQCPGELEGHRRAAEAVERVAATG